MPQRPKRTEPPQAHARYRYSVWVVCGLLLLAVGLVFGQTVRHDFINLDDPEYVSENPHVTQGLSTEGIVWALTHRHHYNWCPLMWWSYMLDSQFCGTETVGIPPDQRPVARRHGDRCFSWSSAG